RLVLVGRIGWERGFPVHGASDITVLGHVSDDELAALYASCTAFVFPSFYEGFGIPVHEAVLAGAPVLCSDIPVFREIGGELVQYVDPYDDAAMAKAIIARCQEPAPAVEQVDRHLERYGAAAAGRALLAVYRAALGPYVRSQAG